MQRCSTWWRKSNCSTASSAGSPAKPSESVGGGEAADGFSGSPRAAATAAAAPPGGEAATTLSSASRVARMRRAVSVVALLPAAGAAGGASTAGSAGLTLRSCCCAAPNRDRPAPLTKGVRPARHERRSALAGAAPAMPAASGSAFWRMRRWASSRLMLPPLPAAGGMGRASKVVHCCRSRHQCTATVPRIHTTTSPLSCALRTPASGLADSALRLPPLSA